MSTCCYRGGGGGGGGGRGAGSGGVCPSGSIPGRRVGRRRGFAVVAGPVVVRCAFAGGAPLGVEDGAGVTQTLHPHGVTDAEAAAERHLEGLTVIERHKTVQDGIHRTTDII